MSLKRNITKILFLTLWIALGTGILVLLVAAIGQKKHKVCNGVEINIRGVNNYFFLDRNDVMQVIAPDKNNLPQGKKLSSFDLQQLEHLLKRNVWVKNAELFFDNKDVMRVNIDEREPIARIFTFSGNSFYIDSSCKFLPISDKMAIRLPVFTNFPSDKEKLHGADSLLMQQVKRMSLYMMKDTFWLAQIAQTDITDKRTFEMVPVIGNHTIVFGDGENYASKFHRLLLFYQQVSATVGFDKYSTVNVEFDGQIVGTKRGTMHKVDSLQALKNIQQLIESSRRLMIEDTVSTPVDNNIMVNQ